MDRSEGVAKGRAGRPNYPIEFKRRLAVESCEPEIFVAKLALRHGLNVNMLFKWRREYRAGKLGIQSRHCQTNDPLFLPVVTSATPSKIKPAKAAPREAGYIEILRGDARSRICGDVSASALRLVLDCLAARE
ncbi:transposase [Zoogloea sp.]|uniref:IS66-like element accessory protein TnpA n=1 Tax=Zoogloea sp. TaxID=49181 RepID=UPI002590BDD6|nr:transposase [Zoogloea sp.]MDD2670195.1 transposase [Zoogloea sp.]